MGRIEPEPVVSPFRLVKTINSLPSLKLKTEMTSDACCFVCQNPCGNHLSLLSSELSLKLLCKLFNLPCLAGAVLKLDQISQLKLCRICDGMIQEAKKTEEEIKSLNLKIELITNQLRSIINGSIRKAPAGTEVPIAVATVGKYFFQCLNKCEVLLRQLDEVDVLDDVSGSHNNGGILEVQKLTEFKANPDAAEVEIKEDNEQVGCQDEDLVIVPFYMEQCAVSHLPRKGEDNVLQHSSPPKQKRRVKQLLFVRDGASLNDNNNTAGDTTLTDGERDQTGLKSAVTAKTKSGATDWKHWGGQRITMLRTYRNPKKTPETSLKVAEESKPSNSVGHSSHESPSKNESCSPTPQEKEFQSSSSVPTQRNRRKQCLLVQKDMGLRDNTAGDEEIPDVESDIAKSCPLEPISAMKTIPDASVLLDFEFREENSNTQPVKSRLQTVRSPKLTRTSSSPTSKPSHTNDTAKKPLPRYLRAIRERPGGQARKCKYCGCCFLSCRQPSNSANLSDPKYFYICNLQECCGGQRIFKFRRQFTRHHWRKCPQNPNEFQAKLRRMVSRHPCDRCEKVYTSISALRNHVALIHEKKYRFCCEKCGAGFLHNGELERHMSAHSSDRPVKCDLCDKTFKRGKSLVEHMRSHTGEQPYVCEICGRAFNRLTNFHGHLENVHGEAKYPCEICGKLFRSKLYVYFHNKTVHKEKKNDGNRDGDEDAPVSEEATD